MPTHTPRKIIPYITMIFCLAPSIAMANPMKPDVAEKFFYHVHFGKSRVANVSIFTGCTNARAKPAALMAVSQGLAQHILQFKIRFDTMLRPQTTQSRLGLTSITEDGQNRSFRSSFHPNLTNKTYTIKVRSNRKGVKKQDSLTLPHEPHDMVSWLLALREQPKLTHGQQLTYYIWDGWKLFKLDAKVQKPQTMTTARFSAKAYQISLKRTRLHHKGKKKLQAKKKPEHLGTLWLTADKKRIPMAIDFKAPVGSVQIRMISKSQKTCKTPTIKSIKPAQTKTPSKRLAPLKYRN